MLGCKLVYRLLYVSVVAAAHLPSELEDILYASMANNRRDRITGFLVCDGMHFVQILEGPKDLVRACMDRIVADPRHTDVRVLEAGFQPTRLFPRWSMCALYLSPLDDALLGGADLSFDLSQAVAGALVQHLRGLSMRHGAQLTSEHGRLLAKLGV